MNKRYWKFLMVAAVTMLITALFSVSVIGASAATGDVAGAVEDTWNSAQGQIKAVVNNVVFPVVDMNHAILLFVKPGTA